MKVLLVSQEFPPETRWGGIGTYAGILAPALARAGADVSVLSVVRGQAPSDRVIDGVRVHRRTLRALQGLGRFTRLHEAARRFQIGYGVSDALSELVRVHGRYDVVEAPEWNAEALRIAGVPLVVRLHSMAAQLFPFLGAVGLDERLAIALERRAIQRATIVTGTAAQISAVRTLAPVPAARLREITLPVERVSPDLDFARSEPGRIVFVGRFEQRKAPEVLIDALPHVCARVPGARLVLVGRDCARPEHQSAVTWLRERAEKLGVGDALEIVDGWAGPLVVREQLLRARVFASPSRWESFSYVAAEAAAVGRPVLASDLPGFRDVVEPGVNGHLVGVDDVAGWVDAITGVLLHDDGATAMGRAGADRIATLCDPDRIAHLTLDAYAEAMAAARRRSLLGATA